MAEVEAKPTNQEIKEKKRTPRKKNDAKKKNIPTIRLPETFLKASGITQKDFDAYFSFEQLGDQERVSESRKIIGTM